MGSMVTLAMSSSVGVELSPGSHKSLALTTPPRHQKLEVLVVPGQQKQPRVGHSLLNSHLVHSLGNPQRSQILQTPYVAKLVGLSFWLEPQVRLWQLHLLSPHPQDETRTYHDSFPLRITVEQSQLMLLVIFIVLSKGWGTQRQFIGHLPRLVFHRRVRSTRLSRRHHGNLELPGEVRNLDIFWARDSI